jgi:CRP/FNR family cyclic AMP-dependent transcriptional regulator
MIVLNDKSGSSLQTFQKVLTGSFGELFSCLSKNEIDFLTRCIVARTFPKNRIIVYEQEDTTALYLIARGSVKVAKRHEDGKEVVIALLFAGDYFGEMALIDEEPRSTSVVARERAEIYILKRKDLLPILMRNCQLALNIMKVLTRRLREASRKIANLAFMDVYGRVVQLFLDLGKQKDGVLIIEEPLTQQDIANMVGSSREMISRILKDLLKGDYIEIDNRKVTIKKTLPQAW